MILLAGVGAVVLVELVPARPAKALACLLLALAAYDLAHQAYKQNFTFFATDPRNPYVYADTSPDLVALVDQVEDIARVAPEGRGMVIKVIAPESDYWPLPWYLRRFPNVGYWQALPRPPTRRSSLSPTSFGTASIPSSTRRYFTETRGLRPGVFLAAYIRRDLRDAFMAGNSVRK